jgi:pimeloyl-ACP methyl ester carboxylesterase
MLTGCVKSCHPVAMRRFLLLALIVLVPAPEATAQERCPREARCTTVTVPLDRTGAVPGSVRLSVGRIGPRRPALAPVVALTGGPGQGAMDFLVGYSFELGERVVARRGVIAFDSRGSGSSQVVSCPEMQRAGVPRDTAAAEACAKRLGERRRFYTVIEQAEDLEAVRAALKLPKLSLYGTSYGTKVALVYARLHPDRVDRLVLDSAVPAEGASALSQEIIGAIPRVLGARLPQITSLVEALRAAPLTGTAFDGRGRAHRVTADPAAIFDVLLAADFNPVMRQALPAAARAALAGDGAPLLRLVHAARESEKAPTSARDFSAGLYAAASCEEIAFPWAPTAGYEERVQRALEAAQQAPLHAPFAAPDLLTLDWIPLCLRWPATPGPRPLPPAVPDVPALLLSGEQDLRTPLEDARRIAATMPRARVLSIAGVGHSVVGSDPSECARGAVRTFLLERRPASRCRRARTGYERGIPTPPRELRGAEPRRTLRAVQHTLEDASLALAVSATGERAGGLRGGSARYSPSGLPRLSRYEYVPGIRVSTSGNRITVSGPKAARGTLVVSGRRVRGRLGGRRVG